LAGWAQAANLAEDGAQQVAAFAIVIPINEYKCWIRPAPGDAWPEEPASRRRPILSEDYQRKVAIFASLSGLAAADCRERGSSSFYL